MIDSEMVQKIPACLAHPIGTLPKSFPENQTEEELLDLVLAGRGGLIAKTYMLSYISCITAESITPAPKLSFLFRWTMRSSVRKFDKQRRLYPGSTMTTTLRNDIYKVSVWNQAEFKVGSGGLSLEDIVEYKVNKSVAFTDEWVSTFGCLGAQERNRNWSYGKVDRFLHIAIGRSLEEMKGADSVEEEEDQGHSGLT
jgi:hypothetical protein